MKQLFFILALSTAICTSPKILATKDLEQKTVEEEINNLQTLSKKFGQRTLIGAAIFQVSGPLIIPVGLLGGCIAGYNGIKYLITTKKLRDFIRKQVIEQSKKN